MPNLPEKQAEWNKVAAKVIEEVAEWRESHAEASFVEIEEAIDQRLAKLRSQMLKDSSQEQVIKEAGDSPNCAECGVRLQKRGKRSRRVLTERNENLELERDYLVCPKCGVGFFPPR
jgi:uncharacterized protein with PIN domain